MDVTGDDALQRTYHVAGRKQRIDAGEGAGTVTGFAFDGDGKHRGGRIHAAGHKLQLADIHRRFDVQADDGIHARILKTAFFDHRLRAAAGFFGRLK